MNNTNGNIIRKLRLIRGMNLSDFQKATGINSTWLSRIETGRVNPTEDELARIKAALGWTPQLEEHLEALV